MMAGRNGNAHEMGRFDHGGDVHGLGDVVDFSSSLNPLGMPAQVVRALQEQAPSFAAYPDPLCRGLVGRIAEREGADASRIVVTAGATDALTRIASAVKPRKALLCSPCYSGYEQALLQRGSCIVRHSLVMRDDFDMTEGVLDELAPDIDAFFLANPNNPTGRAVSRELLCKVLRTADRWGSFVVVDESFLGFTDEHSAVSLLDRHDRLIVVGSFTKTYALAGLRLGWCACGGEDVARAVRLSGMPWAVSTPAQIAGMAALDVPGYLELAREYVAGERARLEAGLRALGMFVVPSCANFVLFQSPVPLYGPLLERGILVRRCANFAGLDQSWFRVAVRTSDDNTRLLAALGEVLA